MVLQQRSERSLASFLALLLFLLLSTNSVGADAASSTRIERAQSVSAASWSIVAQGRNQPLTSSPYLLVWTVTGGTAHDYFRLLNVGSATIQGLRVLITQIRLTGNARSQEIFFERCINGLWDPATNLCSGSIVLVGRASDSPLLLSNLNLPSGSFVDMRARTLPNNQSTFETSLSTEVSRSDIRTAEVRNS